MSKKISRRQFLNAIGVVAASQMLEGCGILKGLSLFKNRNLIGEHLCRTPCGDVQGMASSMAGVTAYKGIRYAEAGRWEYPRQITSWEGVYDATNFGPLAMQDNAITPEEKNGRNPFYYHEFREGLNYTYSEDCQYLNIWAPDNAKNAPVIVYIHGGAWMGGSGWEKEFDEPVWPQKGVIAVTLNYRLSCFGFACLPELTAEAGHSGNYALYDQLCALQWVHDNIEAFGGNPNNITLMGQSAGACSVQLLCSTHDTENLISKAVMSSGAGDESALFNNQGTMEERYDFWKSWMANSGASTLEELRALPAADLLAAFGMQFARYGYMGVMNNLGPVWDNASFSHDGFTLSIPYLAGGTTEDQVPGLSADGLRWCKKQSKDSYAWDFARQLPGDDRGAWHSSDLWYWFGTLNNCWRPFTEEDYTLSNTMVQYLTNFAHTGNPNSRGLPTWETAQSSGQVMRFDVPNPAMAELK